MAFPTVPTVASGDLLSSTTSPASTTHTFPNLSSLRGGAGPQAGDLLIAICIQYGAATAGNQYSSWGALFTEMLDDSLSSGTGVGALGIAYKIASGSESGTFAVTSVTSSKSVQFLMRIPAGEWRETTIPEVQAATRATGAVANPASFDPAAWGAEDTLWIAVAGQTETTTTGSPPTLDSPPSGYSGQLIVARAADAVGDITAGVAFRQVNASAEDIGAWTASNANRGNGIATVIAVRPAPATLFGVIDRPITFIKSVAGIILPQTTPVAEISLASHGVPSARTNHSIKIRARTTTGSTGVIKAALYEGVTNRSGDLTSNALTNALADYTLAISEASAANITDYSNLSIKLWGYAPDGGSLVFEVADVYLELPESSVAETFFGVTSTPLRFTKSVIGQRETFSQIDTPINFGNFDSYGMGTYGVTPYSSHKAAVIGYRKTFSQIAAPFTFTKSVSGIRKTFSQIAAQFTFTKVVSGIRETFGQTVTSITATISTAGIKVGNTFYGIVAAPFTFTKSVSGQRKTFGQVSAPFTFSKAVSGIRTTFSSTATSITATITTAGNRVAATLYGIVAASFTFTKSVIGQRKTFGQTASSYTFVKDVRGFKSTIAQIAAQFTFNKVVSGTRTTFSSIATSITATIVTAGFRVGNIVYGVVSAPFLFSKSVIGQRTTFGQILFPVTFTKSVIGQRITFSAIVRPFTFTKDVIGRLGAKSALITSFTFNKDVIGRLGAKSALITSFTFNKDVIGRKTTFGQTTIPVVFTKAVSGQRKTFSQIAAPFTFTKSVLAKKTTFAQIDRPVTFYKEVAGRKQTFAQAAFPINLSFSVVAEVQGIRYGRTDMSLVFGEQTAAQRKTFSQIASPYLFAPAVQGNRTTFGRFDRPFIFNKSVIGQRETFGQIAFPIHASVAVSGRRVAFGNLAMGLIFGEQTAGQRKAFGQILSPYLFVATTQAERTTFGKLDTDIDFLVDVHTGRVEAFSALALEILIGLETAGFVRAKGIILNLAKEIYLGSTSVDSVYTEGQKVWPPSN